MSLSAADYAALRRREELAVRDVMMNYKIAATAAKSAKTKVAATTLAIKALTKRNDVEAKITYWEGQQEQAAKQLVTLKALLATLPNPLLPDDEEEEEEVEEEAPAPVAVVPVPSAKAIKNASGKKMPRQVAGAKTESTYAPIDDDEIYPHSVKEFFEVPSA